MPVNWARRETVAVERDGERFEYVFHPDSERGWCVGTWTRHARTGAGEWQAVECWNRQYSRDAWEPERPAEVMAALRARLAQRQSARTVRAFGVGVAAVCVLVWGVSSYLS